MNKGRLKKNSGIDAAITIHWTLKEATLKALEIGLNGSLKGISIDIKKNLPHIKITKENLRIAKKENPEKIYAFYKVINNYSLAAVFLETNTMRSIIGITDIAYYLPEKIKELSILQKEKKLESNLKQLKNLGFKHARIAENQSHEDLAKKTLNNILQHTTAETIDLFLYSAALPGSVTINTMNKDQSLSVFKYTAGKLQYDFGLTKATTMGISQQGCVSIMSALWIARNTLLAEDDFKTALCVSSDVLPSNEKREIIYNVISDAACAVILKKNSDQNKILAYEQVSKGYYWDPSYRKNELVAAYFPTALYVIEKVLKKAKLKISDIDWIIPHNVNMRSWEILLGLLHFPKQKFFGENIIEKGHTIAADNFINLKDAIDKKYIKKNQKILLFTFGFGAHWSCMIIEH